MIFSRQLRRIFLPALVAVASLGATPALAAYNFPPPPTSGLIWDNAGLLRADERRAIEALQSAAWDQHHTPIVVVTVHRVSKFGGSPDQIEHFARAWFDSWGIGSRMSNTGMLVLVSSGDRRARIELGADWGHEWDAYCQQVMDEDMVPAFKHGDYAGGIEAGVKQLSRMAAETPSGTPPAPSLQQRLQRNQTVRTVRQFQPISLTMSLLLVGLGLAFMVAGLFIPQHRKVLLIAGGALFVAGISVFLLFMILAIVLRAFGGFGTRGSWHTHSGFGGGFGGGGGSFGGGFSGGGGASGSW